MAALGDSFTDGMTLPAELTWPARLARHLGVSVRNYGTSGFRPGQELLVLKQYVRSRRVVVGSFAGNDPVDAERLESFQRDGGAFPALRPGLEVQAGDRAVDRLYMMSLHQGASGFVCARVRGPVDRWASPRLEDYSGEEPVAPAMRPSFDRGPFTVPVAGRVLLGAERATGTPERSS